eukprot:g1375.t1
MDTRGIKINVLQDISKRLNEFNNAERVFYKGNSAIRLANNVLQTRKINGRNEIVREFVFLNKYQILDLPTIKAAIGDRVKNNKTEQVYAVTKVTKHKVLFSNTYKYTLTPLKHPEKFRHEANFAHWDWDITKNIIVTNRDFKGFVKYERDTFMTTKDAMEEITKFDTTSSQLSYLELLASDDKLKQNVGKANRFISHAWKYKFEDIVQSLTERIDPNTDYIWFDICTVNQHVWKDVDFQTTFKDAVGEIGHTMLILAPWKNPIPLTRSWCLWEINSTIETNSKLEVVLPKSQEKDFIDTLLNNYDEIMKNLCNIDTRNSKAGNENDEKKIKSAVEATNGAFQAVNQNCQMGIQSGLVDIGKSYLEQIKVEKDDIDNIRAKKLDLMNQLGRMLIDQNKYNEAKKLLQQVVDGNEEIRGLKHPSTLDSVRNLAQVDVQNGETLHQRALNGFEEIYGPMHPETLRSVSYIGLQKASQRKLSEAKELLQRVMDGYTEMYGPNHEDTLASVHTLGTILLAQISINEAKLLFRRALNGREEILGPKHPDTLSTISALGTLLYAQSNLKEAEPLLRQSNLKEAEPLLRRALNGYEELHGPNHSNTKSAANKLALVLEDQGNLIEAEIMYRRALIGAETIFVDQVWHDAWALGIFLKDQNRLDEAEPLLRRVLDSQEETLGPRHLTTLNTLLVYGDILVQQGRLDKAETLLLRALDGREEELGPRHLKTLESASKLALLLEKQNKLKEAEQLHRRVLNGYEEKLAPTHLKVSYALMYLIRVLWAQGKLNEAESAMRRLLKVCEEVNGPKHVNTLVVAKQMAELLQIQGKTNEGKTLLQQYEIE